MAFSQGHHPLPRFSFGPALPLGVSSDDEYVDLELTAPLDAEEVAARLAAELPDGLEPVAAAEVPRSAPSIESEIESVTYTVDLAALDAPPPPAAVAAAVARFTTAPSVPVAKRGKSGERTVDARRFVRALELAGPDRLVVELGVGREGTLKAGTLVGELLGLAADVSPALRVHKVATRFRAAAEPAAAASA